MVQEVLEETVALLSHTTPVVVVVVELTVLPT